MDKQKIFDQIVDNIETVEKQDSPLGVILWQEFVRLHPADIAQFLSDSPKDHARTLFLMLTHVLQAAVFSYFSSPMMLACLKFLDDNDRSMLLSSLPLDELTDLFDDLSDKDLKVYLKLLHKRDREKVVSLRRFDPDTAGGIMHTDVITLMQDFTIEKSIQILQRLQPSIELHPNIYVTNQENELVGHINLQDLVLKPAQTRLSSILRKNELVVGVNEDQERIAHQMVRYSEMTVPVVGENNVFLGIIPSEALVTVLEQEAAEDVYRISAVGDIKHTYFETPFLKLLFQRSSILIVLLLIQILSSVIIKYYETLLMMGSGFLYLFITMIQSTGGNSSSQSSALAIQGISSGEITSINVHRFLRRELAMAVVIGVILGIVSFIRIYVHTPEHSMGALAVSVALSVIVIVSNLLGSLIPIVLRRLNVDPAFSAGPVLATIMDILGLYIYCQVSMMFLK
jgi:magnesium transporter